MMTPAAGKTCVVCGQDCSGKPRVKDPAGHYFCKPCYDQALQRKQAAAVAAPAAEEDPFALHLEEIVSEIPEAPSMHACPKCGAAMAEGAQLCVHCGFNARTGARTRTIAVKSRPTTPGGSAWPIVVGVVSIVLGGGGAILYGFQLLGFVMAATGATSAKAVLISVGAATLPFLLSLWLLIAGIGVARRRAESVSLLKRWAIVKIIVYGTCLSFLAVAMLAGAGPGELTDKMGGIDQAAAGMLMLALMAWFLAWPVFVLAWTARRAVKDDIDAWR
jgi:hypothetical protein